MVAAGTQAERKQGWDQGSSFARPLLACLLARCSRLPPADCRRHLLRKRKRALATITARFADHPPMTSSYLSLSHLTACLPVEMYCTRSGAGRNRRSVLPPPNHLPLPPLYLGFIPISSCCLVLVHSLRHPFHLPIRLQYSSKTLSIPILSHVVRYVCRIRGCWV